MKIFITSILLSTYAYGADCEKHPIFCQIKKNSPRMNNKKAMTLSNIIYKTSRKFKIPAHIYTAILKQESNYILSAKGCHRGMLELNANGGVALTEVKICSDFGISQIYYKTARGYGFSITSLITDLEYSVNAGGKVLGDFKKYSKDDPDWWLRYNCGTRSTTKRDTCQIYKKLVERYY